MKKICKRISDKIKGNDISIRIYVSFAFVLIFTGLLTGAIFIIYIRKIMFVPIRSFLQNKGK